MNRKDSRIFLIIALTPALILITVVLFVPIVTMIITSFVKWESIRNIEGFVGLQNYRHLFTDPLDKQIMFKAIRNNLSWLAVEFFIHIPMSVLVAFILNNQIKGWKAFRVLLFIPHLISITVYAFIAKLFYNPMMGVLNALFTKLGFENLARINWLFDTKYAWMAIILTWVFHIGYGSVLILSEMASIPIELYECADMEGARKYQQHWYITLPHLRRIIGTLAILSVSWGLRYFEGIFLMTNGAPNYETSTLALVIYHKLRLIKNSEANAIGVLLLFFGIVIVVIINKLFRLNKTADKA